MTYKTLKIESSPQNLLFWLKEKWTTILFLLFFLFLFLCSECERKLFFPLIPDVVTNLKRFIQTLESLLMTTLIWEKCWALCYRKFHNYEMVVLQTFRHKMSIGIYYFGIGKKLIKEGKKWTFMKHDAGYFNMLSHLILWRKTFFSHFTKEETEAQGKVKKFAKAVQSKW